MSSSSSALSSARRRRAAPPQDINKNLQRQQNTRTNQTIQNQVTNQNKITPNQLLQQHDLRLHKLENDIPDVINEIQQNMSLLLQEREEKINIKLNNVDNTNTINTSNTNNTNNDDLINKINVLEKKVQGLQDLLLVSNITLLKLVEQKYSFISSDKNTENTSIKHVISDDNIKEWISNENNEENVQNIEGLLKFIKSNESDELDQETIFNKLSEYNNMSDFSGFEEHHKKINIDMNDLSTNDNNLSMDIQELKDELYNNQDDETETDENETDETESDNTESDNKNKKVIYADDGTNLDWNDYREMEKYRRE